MGEPFPTTGRFSQASHRESSAARDSEPPVPERSGWLIVTRAHRDSNAPFIREDEWGVAPTSLSRASLNHNQFSAGLLGVEMIPVGESVPLGRTKQIARRNPDVLRLSRFQHEFRLQHKRGTLMRLSCPPHRTGTLRNRSGIRRHLAGPRAEGRMRLSSGMLMMIARRGNMRKETAGCRERQGEIDAGNAECDAGQDVLDGTIGSW